jgi:hypothetical protein
VCCCLVMIGNGRVPVPRALVDWVRHRFRMPPPPPLQVFGCTQALAPLANADDGGGVVDRAIPIMGQLRNSLSNVSLTGPPGT